LFAIRRARFELSWLAIAEKTLQLLRSNVTVGGLRSRWPSRASSVDDIRAATALTNTTPPCPAAAPAARPGFGTRGKRRGDQGNNDQQTRRQIHREHSPRG
jgi:hypothetical protein